MTLLAIAVLILALALGFCVERRGRSRSRDKRPIRESAFFGSSMTNGSAKACEGT